MSDEGPTNGRRGERRGALLVSIDFEMAWGLVHRNGRADYDVDDERVWLAKLLDLFDRHETPATWATVGHLLLDGCGEGPDGRHPEIERPDYPWFAGDWFDQDPCSTTDAAPRWYAPDVVADLLARPVGHELGCHSFSHVLAGDPGCSAAAFGSELDASARAAAVFGAELRSFVYPRNNIGHVDELVSRGYSNYRGKRADPFTGRGARIARLADRVVPSRRSVVEPIGEPGIWNLPATCLFTIEGRRRPALWLRQMRRRLDHAARHGGLFHLWFHPHNIVRGGDVSIECLDELLGAAARLRDEGRLDTLTMGAYAAQLGPPPATDDPVAAIASTRAAR